jgi:hypothetical protein
MDIKTWILKVDKQKNVSSLDPEYTSTYKDFLYYKLYNIRYRFKNNIKFLFYQLNKIRKMFYKTKKEKLKIVGLNRVNEILNNL